MKRSPLLSIFLIVLIDILGYTIMIPLLPFYAERYGAGPFVIGLLLACYGFCQMLAGPVLGHISDRVGRKPVLLASQIGTFAGFLILAGAPTLFWVFVSRIIDGLTAGNLAVAQAYISDVTEPKDRAKSFGLIGISFGLGFLIGPTITGILSPLGFHAPIFAAAALSLTSILATAILLPKACSIVSNPVNLKQYSNSFQDKKLSPLLWQFFAFIFSFSLFISGFALFAERRFMVQSVPFGAKEVGYVFAYVGFLGVIIQGALIGRLVQAFGERNLVQIGFGFMAAGFLLLGGVSTLQGMILAVTILFIGSSILRPSVTSLITQQASRGNQGRVLGITHSIMSLTQIMAPVLSGVFIQQRLLSPWAWCGTLFSGAGLALVMRQKIMIGEKE